MATESETDKCQWVRADAEHGCRVELVAFGEDAVKSPIWRHQGTVVDRGLCIICIALTVCIRQKV